jgi:pimeloyl-ACP methyl ester carboxylesterase
VGLTETLSWREVRWGWSGTGPPVVFCHGTPWSSELWRPFAEALSRDFTVHLWDMPGYGRSSKRPEHPVSLDVQAALLDVVALAPWGSDFFRLVQRHADVFVTLPPAVHAEADERYTDEVEPAYPGLDLPVLVAWGTEDSWIPVDRARRLARLIPGARVELIADAGHPVQLDQPVAVAAAVASWLLVHAGRPA